MTAAGTLGRLRPPPHDLDAERAVIGAVIIRHSVLDELELEVDDFMAPAHHEIWAVILALQAAGKPAGDVRLISDGLRAAGKLDLLEGKDDYLVRCADEVPIAANVQHYARIVRGCAIRRRVLAAAAELQAMAYDDGIDAEQLVADARGRFAGIELATTTDAGPVRIGDALGPAMTAIEQRQQDPLNYGVPTGITRYDRRIGCLGPSRLIIVAARPGMGKSSYMVNVADYASAQGIPVLIFSLEMEQSQVVQRFFSGQSQVPVRDMVCGDLDYAKWQKVTGAACRLRDRPVWIDERVLTVQQICSTARVWWHRNVPKPATPESLPTKCLVAIDYLQIIPAASGSGRDNREQQVSAISRSLKLLSKQLKCPVMALSQITREVEKEKRRPRLSDLRESGALEQDADVAIFLHHEERTDGAGAKLSDQSGEAELIVGKNRDGATGTIDVWWNAPTTQILNIDENTGQGRLV